MISCKEAARRISQAQDGDLPTWDRVLLRLHLCICYMCRAYKRQVRFMHEVVAARMRDPDSSYGFVDVALSPEARERLRAAVAAESTRLRGDI